MIPPVSPVPLAFLFSPPPSMARFWHQRTRTRPLTPTPFLLHNVYRVVCLAADHVCCITCGTDFVEVDVGNAIDFFCSTKCQREHLIAPSTGSEQPIGTLLSRHVIHHVFASRSSSPPPFRLRLPLRLPSPSPSVSPLPSLPTFFSCLCHPIRIGTRAAISRRKGSRTPIKVWGYVRGWPQPSRLCG